MKIGLVLSGGGARGYAHIGLLKNLDEKKISISAIAGSSIGAMIGISYATGKTAKEIEAFFIKYEIFQVVDISFSRLGIKNATKLQKLLEKFWGVKRFEELKIPTYVNAVNITTGKEVIFSKGKLFTAIRASIAIPGVFAPAVINNQQYVDGSILNHLPATILPKQDQLILSNVSTFRDGTLDTSLKSLLKKTINLMQRALSEEHLKTIKTPYILIEPDVSKYYIFERKKKYSEIIKAGYEAAQKQF
jgi:NTE family protein